MCEYYYDEKKVQFSKRFVRLFAAAFELSRDVQKQSDIESRILFDVMQGASKIPGPREINLSGLTKTGVVRLQKILEANNIAYEYVPTIHHYRAPSEPAKLIISEMGAS